MTETVTPTLNRRQQAKEATRVKVLAAARSVFASQGYENATIRLIARAAGMSTGSIFANWKGKAELYVDAIGHPPVTPEIGRKALRALRAFQLVDALVSDSAHPAYRVCYDFSDAVLEAAQAPPLAAPTGANPMDSVDRFLRGDL